LLNSAKAVASQQQFSQQGKARNEIMRKKVLFICRAERCTQPDRRRVAMQSVPQSFSAGHITL
jgi:hypothetical protein